MTNETIQTLWPNAQARSIQVSCQVEDKLYAYGDTNQIKHVLENLLDNAIKFNVKGGKVEILAKREDEMVKVCVTDTGIGIGLSIAKYIVEAHGGRIWAISKPGEGSKFCFMIPAQEES